MLFIVLIISILLIFFIYAYLNQKILTLRQKQIFMANQYNKLSNKYSKLEASYSNIKIKYTYPSSKSGITSNCAKAYILPISNSYLVKNINSKMDVTILDEAEVNSESWFYVSFDCSSRGWIKAIDFSVIYNNNIVQQNSNII